MDILIPSGKGKDEANAWTRVDIEHVRADNAKRLAKKKIPAKMLSACESENEEEMA